jgi:MraZ protein
MDGNQQVQRLYYNSIYRYAADERRRVQVPAMWRPAEEGVEFTLILWPASHEGPCLRVLPPKEMAKLMDSIEAMPNGERKTALKRVIGTASVQVALDRGGRICIPEDMAGGAGIKAKTEVVLVGLLDRFEIWNPERYERVKAADTVLVQEAFKLME